MKIKLYSLIPAVMLAALGLILCLRYIYNVHQSFTVITHSYDITKGVQKLSNNKIIGSFTAHEDYLGTLHVRFNISDTMPGNTMTFRLKEKGSEAWYYEHTNRVSAQNFLPTFPIGFPVITDSKNKEYVFEFIVLDDHLRPTKITKEVSLTQFVTRHHFPKSDLVSQKHLLAEFLWSKFNNIFADQHFLPLALFFFLPFFYFLVRGYLRKDIFSMFFLVLFIVFVQTNYFLFIEDKVYIVLSLVWLHYSLENRVDARLSFLLAIICTLMLVFIRIFGSFYQIENAAIWVYMFFLVGAIVAVRNIVSKKQIKVTLNSFLKMFYNVIYNI